MQNKKFYWGASTSAHQIEGNAHNNWSVWELKNAARLAEAAKKKWKPWQHEKFPEMFTPENYISGEATDHYNRYEEDFDIIKEGGHTAYRFSIDWARVEPEEGVFDEVVIAHYVDVINALRARDIEPFMTLWHWTHPVWLEDRGGVLATDFPEKYDTYAKVLMDAFFAAGVDIKFIMTLNEPMSVIGSSYIMGWWPHTRSGLFATLTAYKNLTAAHRKSYDTLKKSYPELQVGFTEILMAIEPLNPDSRIDALIVRLVRYWRNERTIKMTEGKFDFLGVQNYTHGRIGLGGFSFIEGEESDLGWKLSAAGLRRVIEESAHYGVPLYVTEDGLADRDDAQRKEFLEAHIAEVMHAREKGIDVRGYFHWSLLDNFEWDKGFWPRFGLVAVNYETQKRTPRPSFYHYKKLIADYTGHDDV